jgi:hypothetical protein
MYLFRASISLGAFDELLSRNAIDGSLVISPSCNNSCCICFSYEFDQKHGKAYSSWLLGDMHHRQMLSSWAVTMPYRSTRGKAHY